MAVKDVQGLLSGASMCNRSPACHQHFERLHCGLMLGVGCSNAWLSKINKSSCPALACAADHLHAINILTDYIVD